MGQCCSNDGLPPPRGAPPVRHAGGGGPATADATRVGSATEKGSRSGSGQTVPVEPTPAAGPPPKVPSEQAAMGLRSSSGLEGHQQDALRWPCLKSEGLLNLFIQVENVLTRDACKLVGHLPKATGIAQQNIFIDLLRLAHRSQAAGGAGKEGGLPGSDPPEDTLLVTSVSQMESLMYERRVLRRRRRRWGKKGSGKAGSATQQPAAPPARVAIGGPGWANPKLGGDVEGAGVGGVGGGGGGHNPHGASESFGTGVALSGGESSLTEVNTSGSNLPEVPRGVSGGSCLDDDDDLLCDVAPDTAAARNLQEYVDSQGEGYGASEDSSAVATSVDNSPTAIAKSKAELVAAASALLKAGKPPLHSKKGAAGGQVLDNVENHSGGEDESASSNGVASSMQGQQQQGQAGQFLLPASSSLNSGFPAPDGATTGDEADDEKTATGDRVSAVADDDTPAEEVLSLTFAQRNNSGRIEFTSVGDLRRRKSSVDLKQQHQQQHDTTAPPPPPPPPAAAEPISPIDINLEAFGDQESTISVSSDDYADTVRQWSPEGLPSGPSSASPSPRGNGVASPKRSSLESSASGDFVETEVDCMLPDCLFYILQWYASCLSLMLGAGAQTTLQPLNRIPHLPEGMHLPEAEVRRRLLNSFTTEDLQALSAVLRRGMRCAVKDFALESLRGDEELNLRRKQAMRTQSWWKEMRQIEDAASVASEFNQHNADVDEAVLGRYPSAVPYLNWRRKSISDGASLVKPLCSPTHADGTFVYTVVLDLDETLIYTRGNGAHLCVRPGSRELLRCLKALGCEVIVWTASTKTYSAAILSNLDPGLEYISECVYRHEKWFNSHNVVEPKGASHNPGHPRKDLALLDRDLDRTIIIDNSANCCYGYTETNAVLVPDFCGLEVEETLHCLCEFFVEMVPSQLPVKVFLREHGHKYLKKEPRPVRAVRSAVPCYIVDARVDSNALPFAISIPTERQRSSVPAL